MKLETEYPTDVNSREITDTSILIIKNYADATYSYVCHAVPGSALTAEVWRVMRITTATSDTGFADGNAKFDNVATDLATVAALSFS